MANISYIIIVLPKNDSLCYFMRLLHILARSTCMKDWMGKKKTKLRMNVMLTKLPRLREKPLAKDIPSLSNYFKGLFFCDLKLSKILFLKRVKFQFCFPKWSFITKIFCFFPTVLISLEITGNVCHAFDQYFKAIRSTVCSCNFNKEIISDRFFSCPRILSAWPSQYLHLFLYRRVNVFPSVDCWSGKPMFSPF